MRSMIAADCSGVANDDKTAMQFLSAFDYMSSDISLFSTWYAYTENYMDLDSRIIIGNAGSVAEQYFLNFAMTMASILTLHQNGVFGIATTMARVLMMHLDLESGIAKDEQSGTPGLIGFLSNDPLDIREDTLLLRPSLVRLRLCFFLEELNLPPPSSHL
ncbi:uncharacterized protein G2W53_040148 [Senna tora]|uniref:Uncharacterized protein n=1 Tax=Senna tora TaxID=362788 RepID=A0A834SQK4_9FABA|nr:uncharacterized protein G2W53_040148 [Senna tora]